MVARNAAMNSANGDFASRAGMSFTLPTTHFPSCSARLTNDSIYRTTPLVVMTRRRTEVQCLPETRIAICPDSSLARTPSRFLRRRIHSAESHSGPRLRCADDSSAELGTAPYRVEPPIDELVHNLHVSRTVVIPSARPLDQQRRPATCVSQYRTHASR